MAKATVPFGEWRPDVALLDSQFAADAENVFAGVNSYKPIPSLTRISNTPIPGTACGLYSARTLSGTWKVYAGNATNLFTYNQTTGWTDISRTVGGAYHVPPGELWMFAQFGDNLTAVNINDVPQSINITSGTNFAALGGSPPISHNVKQIGDFLVLGGQAASPRSIAWSAVNNITGWTPGIGLSDTQDFPDGGLVQGVAGDTIAYVVMDRSIRTMQFLPGDTTTIFDFSKVVQDKGAVSEYGFTTVAGVLYFVSEDGFYALGGNQLIPIGQDKVNEWWLANSDIGRRNLVQIVPSNKPYVVWAYHSTSAVPNYDKIIIYNWSNQRWSRGSINALMWAMSASLGLDLDTDGTETGDHELDSTARPLDSFAYQGGRPIICAFDPQGYLCALNGPNLPATLDTAESHVVPGARTFVSEVYPLVDGAAESVSVATRERLQDPIVWNNPTPLEVTGSASVLTSARLHRFRVQVPAGEIWTHAQGVLAETQPDGAA